MNLPYNITQRNRPIATLLKWYADKGSGKVTDARKEILRRFDYLDWRVQKRIALAFLQGGKSDREWAYRKIYRLWDKCFQEPVRRLWEEHHENMCAWSVIKYFPMDYVKANAEQLEEVNGYYHLCMRLAEEADYVIDRSKLKGGEYLAVMNNCHRKVSEVAAKDIFFQSVYECWIDDSPTASLFARKGHDGVLSVFDIDAVSSVRSVFYAMGFHKLIAEIDEWNQQLMSTVYHSDEFCAFGKAPIGDDEYQEKRLAMMQKYLMIALDDRYIPGF